MDTAATAYIQLNPQVRFGKPIVKGTRTTVSEVLEMLANGLSATNIAEVFSGYWHGAGAGVSAVRRLPREHCAASRCLMRLLLEQVLNSAA